MESNFSDRVKDVVSYSQQEAIRLGHDYIGPEHLLLGLIREGEGLAIKVIVDLGIDLLQLKRAVENAIKSTILTIDMSPPLTRQAEKVLKITRLEAKLLKSAVYGTEHLLLSILREENNVAAQIFNRYGVTYDLVRSELEHEEQHQSSGVSFKRVSQSQSGSQAGARPRKSSRSKTPVLNNSINRNVTKEAEDNKLFPISGSDHVFDRLVTILGLCGRRNPVLISESTLLPNGLIEELALRIVQQRVPRFLFDKVLLLLNAEDLQSGDVQERVRAVSAELKKSQDIILVIDHFPSFFGTELYQILEEEIDQGKVAIGTRSVQCIGLASIEDYAKFIDADDKLRDRFQRLIIPACTEHETIQILEQYKSQIENKHQVNYTEDAIRSCIYLTDHFLQDQVFPDKAVQLMDGVASLVFGENHQPPNSIVNLEAKIDEVKELKNRVVKLRKYEEAAQLRDQEARLLKELEQTKIEWKEETRNKRYIVSQSDIIRLFPSVVSIPSMDVSDLDSLKRVQIEQKQSYPTYDFRTEFSAPKQALDAQSSLQIIHRLMELKNYYETYHSVQYDESCIRACVNQLSQSVSGSHLLKKSLEVLDETGCNVKLENSIPPTSFLNLETKIEEVKELKNRVVKVQKYNEAAQLRDQEKRLLEELKYAKIEWDEETRNKRFPVLESDVSSVIAVLLKTSLIIQSEWERHLASLTLCHIHMPERTRCAYWFHTLRAIGKHTPLGIAHDLGSLLIRNKHQLRIERPAYLPQDVNTTAYVEFLDRLTAYPLIKHISQWKMSDTTIGMVLGKLLEGFEFPADYMLNLAPRERLIPHELAAQVQVAGPEWIWNDLSPDYRPDIDKLLPANAMARIEQNLLKLDVEEVRLMHLYGPRLPSSTDPRELLDLFNLVNLPTEHRQSFTKVLQLIPRLSESIQAGNPQLYTMGGYAGLTHTGNLDNLLSSEPAYPEDIFYHRLLNKEALYYGREGEKESIRDLTWIVTQVGTEVQGDLDVTARAMTLSLARSLSERNNDVKQSFIGSQFSEPEPLERARDMQRVFYYRDGSWARPRQMLEAIQNQLGGMKDQYKNIRLYWVLNEYWDLDTWDQHTELYRSLHQLARSDCWFIHLGRKKYKRGQQLPVVRQFPRSEIISTEILWPTL